jgi:hypothetical protein
LYSFLAIGYWENNDPNTCEANGEQRQSPKSATVKLQNTTIISTSVKSPSGVRPFEKLS